VSGHRWNDWRRLTGNEDYFATCYCAWRSTETGQVSAMLKRLTALVRGMSAAREPDYGGAEARLRVRPGLRR
jgi:hypothetical protein